MANDPLSTLNANLGNSEAGSGTAFYQATPDDPNVYIGDFGTAPRPGGNKPLPGGGRLPTTESAKITLPLSQAQSYIYGMDPAELNKMAERAWYLGYTEVSSPTDVMGFIDLWQKAVANAALFQAQGKNLTPMQVLEYGATGNVKTRAQRSLDGTVQTQKSRSINITDAVSAQALIRQVFQTAYGRDPTDAEIHTLASSLTAAEKNNPSVSVTNASFDSATGNQTGSTTTTSGGINPSAFLDQQVQNDPEAKEYQAASTYFPALMQLMGSAYGL